MRSCYWTTVKWGAGDDTFGFLQWYFAPDGANFFPGPHVFSSLVWLGEGEDLDDGPGEVQVADRTWTNGKTPEDADGEHICSPLDWFVDGVPSPCPPPIPVADDGLPQCCLRNDAILLGGTAPVIAFDNYTWGGTLLGGTDPALIKYTGVGGYLLGGTSPGLVPYVGVGGLLLDGTAPYVYTPPNPCPGGILADTFAEAGPTPLVLHVPDLGPGWNVGGDALQVLAFSLQKVSNSFNTGWGWMFSGNDQIRISIQAILPASGCALYGLLRVSNVNNFYWAAYVNFGGASAFYGIFRRASGVDTLIASAAWPNLPFGGHVMNFEVLGNAYGMNMDGIHGCSTNDGPATGPTGAGIGMYMDGVTYFGVNVTRFCCFNAP